MRALIQRVSQAKVEVAGETIGKIAKGMLILLGIGPADSEASADFLIDKIINLRIFEDENGKMNLSLMDVKGELLVVSQFTLYADLKKGRRPSFIDAAPPALAEDMYKKFVQKCRAAGVHTEEGKFGAMMQVSLVNEGPVTMMVEK